MRGARVISHRRWRFLRRFPGKWKFRVAKVAAKPVEPAPIRCVVVEDHVLVLQMLCVGLRTLGGIDIVATGTSLRDTRRLASSEAIDLLILDSSLSDGDGLEVLRALLEVHPGLKCIVITSYESNFNCPLELLGCIVAIVDKVQSWDTLLLAIERAVGNRLPPGCRMLCEADPRTKLTPRECNVFESLGRGLTNKEIAKALGISVQTVETHRKAVSRKLGCNGPSLVRLATLSQHLSLP